MGESGEPLVQKHLAGGVLAEGCSPISNRDIYAHGRDLAVISSSTTILQIKKLRFREEKRLAYSHVGNKGHSQGCTQAC